MTFKFYNSFQFATVLMSMALGHVLAQYPFFICPVGMKTLFNYRVHYTPNVTWCQITIISIFFYRIQRKFGTCYTLHVWTILELCLARIYNSRNFKCQTNGKCGLNANTISKRTLNITYKVFLRRKNTQSLIFSAAHEGNNQHLSDFDPRIFHVHLCFCHWTLRRIFCKWIQTGI